MPYFERKPYVSAPKAVVPIVQKSDRLPISDVARRVLDAETCHKQQLDGPFQCRKTCKPGTTGTIVLSVAAPAGATAVDMQFEPGDLINREGAVLPADRISVEPARIQLDPSEAADVAVNLAVHDLAEPGLYQGRIHCKGTDETAIVVVFEVALP